MDIQKPPTFSAERESANSLINPANGVGQTIEPIIRHSFGSVFRQYPLHILMVGTLLVLTITGTIYAVVSQKESETNASLKAQPSSKFSVQDVSLGDILRPDTLDLNTIQSLSINGQLRANNSLILAPTTQPTTSNASVGQVYFDRTGNALAYYNGAQFISVAGTNDLDALRSQIATVNSRVSAIPPAQAIPTAVSIPSDLATLGASNIFVSANNFIAGLSANSLSAGTLTTTGNTSLQGSLSVTGNTTLGPTAASSLVLSSPLDVSSGGTGASSLNANGVVIANGSSPLTTANYASAGQCLMSPLSGVGIPVFDTCPGGIGSGVNSLNGLAGNLFLANATGGGTTITINDASTTAKGIASFNATNFSVTGGAVNTIQNIGTGATPAFAGVTASSLTSALNQNLTLNAAGTGNLYLTGYDCSASGGGGKLTVDATGQVACGADGDTDTTGITTITAGDGITITGANNTIAASVRTSFGLQADSSGIGLIDTCLTNEILKRTAGGWACGTDTVGTGDGVGATTVGALDGGTANANGATITSTNLFLQSASNTNPGLINTGIQTFGGAKTFNASAVFAGGLSVSSGQSLTLGSICTASQVLSTNVSGVLTCVTDSEGTDTNTTYTAGNGLSLIGTQFNSNVRTSFGLQADSSGIGLIDTCLTNEILKRTAGGWACGTDTVGTGDGVGATTVGALDGGTANANGATITSTNLFLQSASNTNPGLINTGIQTFGGAKTFNGAVTLAGGATVTGNLAASGTINGATISGGTLSATAVNGLSVSGMAVTGSGALTVASALNTNLTLNAAGTGNLYLTGYDCSASGGDGKLTVDATGQVVCGADGGGSGVSVSGTATDGSLTKFNAAGQIMNSNLSETGTTLTYAGSAVVNAATGFTGNLLDLRLNGVSKLSVTEAGNTTLGGTLAVTGSSTLTGALAANGGITTGGQNVNAAAGTVTGANINATTALQLNGTNINTAGTLTNVAYENQANVFTQNNTFQGSVAVQGAALTLGASGEASIAYNAVSSYLGVSVGSDELLRMYGTIPPAPIVHAIGDTGPAGGKIFYDKGNSTGGWRYLEAAPSDQSSTAPWGCDGTALAGAGGTAIGTGYQNTLDIEAGCATAGTAADVVSNYSFGGYSDWFLPSKDELNQMYIQKTAIGGFNTGGNSWYYSSTEDTRGSPYDQIYAMMQRFSDGYVSEGPKNNTTYFTRAIRMTDGSIAPAIPPTLRVAGNAHITTNLTVDANATIVGTVNGLTLSSTTLTATGALSVTAGTTLTLTSTGASTVSLDSGSTGAINIGAGSNAKTITIGNGTGATSVVISAGTGAINIGTNSVARTTTIGNTTGTSSLVLRGGTGGISLVANTGVTGTLAVSGTTTLTGALAANGGITTGGQNVNAAAGTVTGANINATTALQLNGTNINTAGTLTNVAYEDQSNAFTGQSNSFTSNATTQAGVQVAANSLTTGNGLQITTTSSALVSGNLVDITQNTTYGSPFTSNNSLMNISRTVTGPPVGGAVAFDSASSNGGYWGGPGGYAAHTITTSHTIGTGQNRALIVTVLATNITSVTFTSGSTLPLTQIVSSGGSPGVSQWILLDPPSGVGTVTVDANPTNDISVVASSWSGVNQSSPYGTSVTAVPSANTSSTLNVTTTAGQMVVDAIMVASGSGTLTTSGGGQVEIGEVLPAGGFKPFASSYKPAASSGSTTTMGWSWTGGSYTQIIVATPLNPASTPGQIDGTLTGSVANISSNCSGCAETGSVLNVMQANTFATGSVLNIQNAGTGYGLQVGGGKSLFSGTSGSGWNAAAATLYVGRDTGTLRSINAAGTIGASGADYAEWIPWSGPKPEPGTVITYKGSTFVVSSLETAAIAGNDAIDTDNAILIAFMGQLPVKVTGAVSEGDVLVSNGDGTARAIAQANATLTDFAQRVGIAWESNTEPGVKKIRAAVGTSASGSLASNILQGTGSFDSLNVSGNVTIGGKLVVNNTVEVRNIVVNGHIVSGGLTPTVTVDATLCSAVAASIEGTDTAGTIVVKTNNGCVVNDKFMTLTFASEFSKAPRVTLTAANAKAATVQAYVDSDTASGTSFAIGVANALSDGTTYKWYYQVIE